MSEFFRWYSFMRSDSLALSIISSISPSNVNMTRESDCYTKIGTAAEELLKSGFSTHRHLVVANFEVKTEFALFLSVCGTDCVFFSYSVCICPFHLYFFRFISDTKYCFIVIFHCPSKSLRTHTVFSIMIIWPPGLKPCKVMYQTITYNNLAGLRGCSQPFQGV